MRAAWKKFRYRLEWLALKSVATIIPLLSRKACFRLGATIGALAAKFDRRQLSRRLKQSRGGVWQRLHAGAPGGDRARIVPALCPHGRRPFLEPQPDEGKLFALYRRGESGRRSGRDERGKWDNFCLLSTTATSNGLR